MTTLPGTESPGKDSWTKSESADSGQPSGNREALSTAEFRGAPVHGESFLGLTRIDQWFLGTVCFVGLATLVIYSVRLSGWGLSPVEVRDLSPREFQYRVDINRSNWVEWAQLDGLGEKLARQIVQDRTTRGPFRSIDDLTRVQGIGPASLERLRPWLVCESEQPPADSRPSSGGQE